MNDAYQNKGSAVISFAAVVVIVIGLQMAKDLLVPFLVAAFLALITVRPMLWMQKNRVPAILAALIIVSVIMLILAVVASIVGASIAEFTAALGRALRRPTLFPLPAAALKLFFGEMGQALLLSSTRVRPDGLMTAGYGFVHASLDAALADLLSPGAR